MTLPPATEAQIESATHDLFIRAGWHPVKTDAAQITRSAGRGRVQRGTISTGFPDMLFLLGLPGFNLGLVALVEFKTATGRLRASQFEKHLELHDLYQLRPQIVRSVEQATHLIAEGQRLKKLLRAAR